MPEASQHASRGEAETPICCKLAVSSRPILVDKEEEEKMTKRPATRSLEIGLARARKRKNVACLVSVSGGLLHCNRCGNVISALPTICTTYVHPTN